MGSQLLRDIGQSDSKLQIELYRIKLAWPDGQAAVSAVAIVLLFSHIFHNVWYIYIYIYTVLIFNTHIYIYIYIYIYYVHRERDIYIYIYVYTYTLACTRTLLVKTHKQGIGLLICYLDRDTSGRRLRVATASNHLRREGHVERCSRDTKHTARLMSFEFWHKDP